MDGRTGRGEQAGGCSREGERNVDSRGRGLPSRRATETAAPAAASWTAGRVGGYIPVCNVRHQNIQNQTHQKQEKCKKNAQVNDAPCGKERRTPRPHLPTSVEMKCLHRSIPHVCLLLFFQFFFFTCSLCEPAPVNCSRKLPSANNERTLYMPRVPPAAGSPGVIT